MRELKFRALADFGFVFGYPIIYPDGETFMQEYGGRNDRGEHFFRSVPVRTETLGEYTGLKDKNGRDIYEGDVVLFDVKSLGNLDPKPNQYGHVSVESYGTGFGGWAAEFCRNVLVIGNIHDNPELIK